MKLSINNSKTLALIFVIILVLLSCSVVVFGEEIIQDEYFEEIPDEIKVINARGKVIRNLDMRKDIIEYSGGSLEDRVQLLEVRITTGEFKNTVVEAQYPLSLDFVGGQNNALLRPGNKVLLTLELDDTGNIVSAVIYNPARDRSVLLLVIVFALVILYVGRLKGLKTLISLLLTVLSIFYIMLPLLLKGHDPMLITILVSILITAVTLLLVSGFNKKTLAAVLGTTGGVVAAGILAKFIGNMAKLTGLGTEESQMLLYIPQNINFDYRGLLFAGILLGALGACMDVGLSLSSAIFEIKENNPELNRVQLFKSGMNIGRDMMGTMSNTLILAYVGGSLPLLILFIAHQMPLSEIINQDGFAGEIIRSLAGSIGLILTIPLTNLVAGFFCDSIGRKRG